MATKDYVKRGRAPKKPARKSRKAPPSSGFPFKWAFIALCLVGALGYGLYFLSTNPAPEQEAETVQSKPAPKPQPKPKPKPQTKPLPPKPEEKWRYIEELENKEVQVEAPKKQTPTRPYLMQCGAYRSRNQAEERKAMIAFQGLSSQIKVSQGEKGSWYRVILGPYPQKRKAESDRNMLRRAGIEPCAIWFWE
ncbi:SPOR domain-containing protein [Photobacterium sp. J15]|uniref:SPOR domain-containing protein n=1 Tax=Photobacterium sp. J15 TaxID=265901 RepID=UPI0007E430D3|nr:SPOR domain-containing protein [Photobacterium sp. J15]